MSFQFLVGYCGDSEIHFVRFVSSFTLGSLILSFVLFFHGFLPFGGYSYVRMTMKISNRKCGTSLP
ncbi:hypothetical protein I7I48_02486 [Histoplasma ohiense]|nr:hypothetical protein I7I48_02486 [Histoplasma ohiense (nom. inval.)]